MRVGIFGSKSDGQSYALGQMLQKKGAKVVLVESQGLNQKDKISIENDSIWYAGQRFDDVGSWYLRYMMSPFPAAFRQEDDHYLFSDWFLDYTHKRERYGMQLTWMLMMGVRDVPVINPPEHGISMQLKPIQLEIARKAGCRVPESLLSNDPHRVKAFRERVGEVVYKPSLSGGECRLLDDEAMRRLDLITQSPVLFQERIKGQAVRMTVVGEEIVSAIWLPSETVDYRYDPSYRARTIEMTPAEVPQELVHKTHQLMKDLGLILSGIDWIVQEDGEWVFLEANSSPIYIGIETKTGHPITEKMADLLLKLGNEPAWYHERMKQAKRTESFLAYTLPFRVDRVVGGFDRSPSEEPSTDTGEAE